VNGAEAQRPNTQPHDSLGGDRALEVRRLHRLAQSTGEQEDYRLLVEPPQRERERACRRGIQPLNVVDRDHDRYVHRKSVERIPNRDAQRSWIGALVTLLDQESDLECAAPRRRQLTEHLVECALEQVAEPGVCESSLRFSRPRSEHPQSSFACGLDARLPQGRLPYPRLAFEHERHGPIRWTLESRVHRRKLKLPAYDIDGHGQPTMDPRLGSCNRGKPTPGLDVVSSRSESREAA